MARDRRRIEEDLRGILHGDVRCDVEFCSLYAGDASIHEILPTGVVRPHSVHDVVRCVEYARDHGLTLHPRGAGSGVSGGCLGDGLILDMAAQFQRLADPEDDLITVQPGVVLSAVNRALRKRGRCFGPDPATASVSTVGGIIGRNSSGSRFVQHGSVRDCVVRLQVVTPAGKVVELDNNSAPIGEVVGELCDRLSAVRDRAEEAVPASVRSMPRGLQPGYCLLDSGPLTAAALRDLMVGSEGTLGIVTEATLRTSPIAPCRGVALLSFLRLRDAAVSVSKIREYNISACDLLDRRLLTLAHEESPQLSRWIDESAEAMLLVEVSGDEPDAVRDELDRIARRAVRKDQLATTPRITLEAREIDSSWRIVKHVVPRLLRLRGKTRPLPFMEDAWVPVHQLPALIESAQQLLRKHGVIASVYSHAAHGELHLRPLLDLADPTHIRLMQNLAREYFDTVFELGGAISAEHAWGLSRSWYVREHYPKWNQWLADIKRTLDDRSVMNPGRLGDRHPIPLTTHLRHVVLSPAATTTESADGALPQLLPQLAWSPEDALLATRQCNGCARCRVTESPWRMCPLFHAQPREEATPRAKANLLREVLTGRLSPAVLQSDQLRAIADLCVHCYQCRLECPAEVDVPTIVAEWKAQHVMANGLRLRDWWLARPERFAQLGQRAVRLTNWALANPQARWLLERFTSIASTRKLPKLSKTPFLRMAQKLRLGYADRASRRKVAYLVDVYANWFDTELARATVAVLRHNGYSVVVPARQRPAGMPLIPAGGIDVARQEAGRNVAIFAELVRRGYTVVTSEPSAALCVAEEYPKLLDDDEAKLVADNVMDVGSLLWRDHLRGQLELDFRPLPAKFVYHHPCHLRTLDADGGGDRLLRLVPGLSVVNGPATCSGMAGMFGLRRKNYRTSLRMGWPLIDAVRDHSIQGGTTECSACKLQMEQGGNKPTVHPIKILAWAYQAMPFDSDPTQRVSLPLTVT